MDKDELWRKTLALMLEDVGENDPKTVFLNLLTPLGILGDQFILLAQNAQVESWVRNNYLAEMAECLASVSGQNLNVSIAIQQTSAPAPETSQQAPEAEREAAPPLPRPARQQQAAQAPAEQQPDWMNTYVSPADLPRSVSDRPVAEEVVRHGDAYSASSGNGDVALFEKCTFDTFVVGKSNQFARGAALAVAERPGTAYNPLFIYGGSGLGKTHLLVAIANYVLQNWPKMATVYVSANQFLNDYVEATQRQNWGDFNRKYHSVDVLLVDDVQYLEGAESTIDQLFSIFNEMTNRSKQIVLAADRAPKDIDMDERYRSRFMSGLLADVKPPDYETRLAIMRNYLSRVAAQSRGFGTIPDDVLEWLAGEATSNIREMEGAINRLVVNMEVLGKSSIGVEEAQELLKDFFPSLEDKRVDIATIQSEVERYFGITHEQMVGKTRAKGVTMPRHIAMYLSRYMTEESLQSIGKKFGGRDHTTVMNGVNKIEREQKDNRALMEQIDALTIRIQEHS